MNYCLEHYSVPPPAIFFVLHTYFHVQQGCPGIWIACTYLPPRRRGREKKKSPRFFGVCVICVTIVPKRRILTSRQINVTPHHTPRTTYYTWYCFGFLLGCTLQVVCLTGMQQYLHVLVVQRTLSVLRPNQAFCEVTINRWRHKVSPGRSAY